MFDFPVNIFYFKENIKFTMVFFQLQIIIMKENRGLVK